MLLHIRSIYPEFLGRRSCCAAMRKAPNIVAASSLKEVEDLSRYRWGSLDQCAPIYSAERHTLQRTGFQQLQCRRVTCSARRCAVTGIQSWSRRCKAMLIRIILCCCWYATVPVGNCQATGMSYPDRVDRSKCPPHRSRVIRQLAAPELRSIVGRSSTTTYLSDYLFATRQSSLCVNLWKDEHLRMWVRIASIHCLVPPERCQVSIRRSFLHAGAPTMEQMSSNGVTEIRKNGRLEKSHLDIPQNLAKIMTIPLPWRTMWKWIEDAGAFCCSRSCTWTTVPSSHPMVATPLEVTDMQTKCLSAIDSTGVVRVHCSSGRFEKAFSRLWRTSNPFCDNTQQSNPAAAVVVNTTVEIMGIEYRIRIHGSSSSEAVICSGRISKIWLLSRSVPCNTWSLYRCSAGFDLASCSGAREKSLFSSHSYVYTRAGSGSGTDTSSASIACCMLSFVWGTRSSEECENSRCVKNLSASAPCAVKRR